MRSLIKSHRRSDSSASDVTVPPDALYSKHVPKTTPVNSPMVTQHPVLTPPQMAGSPSTLSSPKKLLTPIKKMFGHHSKLAVSPGVATSVDSLNLAINGELAPPAGKRFYRRGPSSLTNLSELLNNRSLHHKLKGFSSSALLDQKALQDAHSPLPAPRKLTEHTASSSGSSIDTNKAGTTDNSEMPIIFETKNLRSTMLQAGSDSNISSVNSVDKFQAKRALSLEQLADGYSKMDTEAYYEDDDELRHSDTSSQFSFVKDMRAGRNTSVKYYKTKPSSKVSKDSRLNTFNVDDMGFEPEAFADYDFENNGMDDEGYDDEGEDYDDFEANNRYDDFLDEDEQHNTSHLDVELSGFEEEAGEMENHLAKKASSMLSLTTPQPEDTYGAEFLESYLYAKLPMSDGAPRLSLPYPDEGGPSPLISGITFGSEAGLRTGRSANSERADAKDESDEDNDELGLGIVAAAPTTTEPQRHSIINMMSLLSALEEDTEKETGEETDTKESIQGIKSLLSDLEKTSTNGKENKRDLVVNMMNTLAVLENTMAEPTKESKKLARRSIADMMSTLAVLEQNEISDPVIIQPKKPKALERKVQPNSNLKRYSWFNNDEESKFKKHDPSTTDEETPAEYTSGHLDEDLLDEINQLPEDFDFEEHESQLASPATSDFFRSNSYNKKPKKVVVDNHFQRNKIETPLRTVTFYRTNSSGNSDHSRSSVSRAGSTYSATSFTSVGDELLEAEKPRRQSPYSLNINAHLHERSADSLSHKSFSLEPITESPQLK